MSKYWSDKAWDDYLYWQTQDKKTLLKINKLVKDIERNGLSEEFIKRDIFGTNQNVSNTACQTQRDVLESRYTNQLGLQELQASQQNCCCNTQKEIIQNRYDNALQLNNLQAQLAQCCCDLRTESANNTQKILDKIKNVCYNLM